MTLSLLRQRDVYSSINVSPREIDQCLAKRKSSPVDDEEYHLAHILVAVPAAATPAQVEERVARAQDIYERAESGEDFAQLAVSYSNARPPSRAARSAGARAPAAHVRCGRVAALQPGHVTEPIRTPSGLHIFKLVRQARRWRPATMVQQVHARHILLQTNDIQDDATVRRSCCSSASASSKGENFAASPR